MILYHIIKSVTELLLKSCFFYYVFWKYMVYKGMNSRLIQGIKKTPTKKKRRTIKGKSMDPWIGQASKILISCKQYGLTLFTRWSWNGKLFYSSRITGTAKGHLPLRKCQGIFLCCTILAVLHYLDMIFTLYENRLSRVSPWGFSWKNYCAFWSHIVHSLKRSKEMQYFLNWVYFCKFTKGMEYTEFLLRSNKHHTKRTSAKKLKVRAWALGFL